MSSPIHTLSAPDLKTKIATGQLSALEVAEAFLKAIEERETDIKAWAWIDPDHIRRQAEACDARQQAGLPLGPLHGLPVGLKDIIDTRGIPTENGTPADAGRIPHEDAWVVARLKAAGAVIMGKTVTTELAFLQPSKTRNPHNMSHTPGGSSSGSAAAVASGMVPLAVGTQTGGSVIRPASFCGVVGFKPSFGAIPRTGVLQQSETLDTLGVFATTVDGAALLAGALFGHDPADRHSAPYPPALPEIAQVNPNPTPAFVFAHPPAWETATADMQAAITDFAKALAENCETVALPDAFQTAAENRAKINAAEMARNFASRKSRDPNHLSQHILSAMADGAALPAPDYIEACSKRETLSAAVAPLFEKADAILMPSALGPAPGLETTGDSIFNGLWTLTGQPAITLPLLRSPNGLPMGVQLIGPRWRDGAFIRTARWLESHATYSVS